MSDPNEPMFTRGSEVNSHNANSAVEIAKDEAATLTDTAADAANDLGHLTKDEAASVMNETKDQIQGLYEQTRSELTEEASKQQERVATGLHTVGNDLDSMSRNSEDGGLARDLVRETSQRVTRVADWISEREPGDVLDEVKSFARRQPGVFIGVAAIAGVVAGRLTRSLAANAHDDKEDNASATSRQAPKGPARPTTRAVPAAMPEAPGAAGAHAPVTSAARGSVTDVGTAPQQGGTPVTREGGSYERPNTL